MSLKLQDDSSLADRIYDTLEKAILSGQIKLGQRLLETDLAEQLSVSRAPLREALRRLHFEGLATTIPRRGTYVLELARKDVIDLLQVRLRLECLAASLAAEHISDEELEQMSAALKRIQKKVSDHRRGGYPHYDIDFHRAIVEASRNTKIIQIMTGMYRQLRLVRLVSGDKMSRAPQVLEEHSSIYQALERHDSRAAEKAMEAHLRASEKSILETLQLQEDA